MSEYIEERRQIDFLLKELYFVKTFKEPYDFAIVAFGTKTKVYDVITHDVFYPVKKVDAKTLKKYNGKVAYDIVPLTNALIKANITKADPLLTKEDVIFLRSELARNISRLDMPQTTLEK